MSCKRHDMFSFVIMC